MNNIICLNPIDSVGTVTHALSAGAKEEVNGQIIEVQEEIPFAHKIALKDVNKGETVYKYGTSIGIATQDIKVGMLVHTHNLASVRGGKK